jgi:hypothetical protein
MRCRKCRELGQVDPLAFQRAIEEILRRNEIDDFFQANEHCTIKIFAPSPRPLVIQRRGKHVIILEDDTGDFQLVERQPSGPEMEFEIADDGTWIALSLRDEYKRRAKSAVIYSDGCRNFRPIVRRRFEKFAAAWGRLLLLRKFTSGTLRYARKY